MAEQESTPDNETRDRFGTVQVELPASLRYLNVPSAVLHALAERMPDGPPASTVTELELALQEACVNSVEHALENRRDTHLLLRFRFEPNQIEISLEDHGKKFEADGVAVPDLDFPQEGGYGLFLIEQLVDSLSYEREGETNRWLMTKRWKDDQRHGN